MVSILLFEDLLIVPLLVLVAFMSPQVVQPEEGSRWLAIGIGVASLAGLIAAGIWLLNPLFRVLAAAKAREVMTAAALLVVLGAALLVVVAALLRVDVARKMLRGKGLPRFSAACLLAGYAWLAVAGGILLLVPDPLAGGGYDAVVHAVFLGFTMSMIFAHAPVILPAVLRRPLPYRPVLYAPLALLHASLLVRVGIGDGTGWEPVWRWAGVGNVVMAVALVQWKRGERALEAS